MTDLAQHHPAGPVVHAGQHNRAQLRQVQAATTGFKPDRKKYRLTFPEGTTWHGLVVLMRGITGSQFLDLAGMADAGKAMAHGSATAEQVESLAEMFELVGGSILEWNLLDDDDQPVTPGVEALRAEDFELTLTLATNWMEAIGGVPGPLDQPSTAGAPSGVGSLPMEPL